MRYYHTYVIFSPLIITKWDHQTPQIMFMLIYIIAIAMGLAVTAMVSWHLWLVSKGQTSVENHDASHYRKIASSRGEVSQQIIVSPGVFHSDSMYNTGICECLQFRSQA